MKIRCVTACKSERGPDFDFCIIRATNEQINAGRHYAAAKKIAKSKEFWGPMVTFDEYDNPTGLMDFFVWETADTYDITGRRIKQLGGDSITLADAG